MGDTIYVSSYQEVTHALNIRQQRISWSTSLSSFHPLAFDAAYIYASDKSGVIHQVERRSGDISWSQRGLEFFSTSAPIAVGPYVLVADGKGDLFVLTKNDGSIMGRTNLGADTIVGEPIVDGATVYFMDSDGALRSLEVRTSG